MCNVISMWEACASCAVVSCGMEFQMKLPLYLFFEGMGWMDSVDEKEGKGKREGPRRESQKRFLPDFLPWMLPESGKV